jgi:hypothetical protein
MAPLHSETGAMVYLALNDYCRGRREVVALNTGVGEIRNSGTPQALKPTSTWCDPGMTRVVPLQRLRAFDTTEVVPGYRAGMKPRFHGRTLIQNRVDAHELMLPGFVHLKSFPSEKNEKRTYV